jgi:hypothetical protein
VEAQVTEDLLNVPVVRRGLGRRLRLGDSIAVREERRVLRKQHCEAAVCERPLQGQLALRRLQEPMLVEPSLTLGAMRLRLDQECWSYARSVHP